MHGHGQTHDHGGGSGDESSESSPLDSSAFFSTVRRKPVSTSRELRRYNHGLVYLPGPSPVFLEGSSFHQRHRCCPICGVQGLRSTSEPCRCRHVRQGQQRSLGLIPLRDQTICPTPTMVSWPPRHGMDEELFAPVAAPANTRVLPDILPASVHS